MASYKPYELTFQSDKTNELDIEGVFTRSSRDHGDTKPPDFHSVMPDLETASKNHIADNLETENDIERETAVIIGAMDGRGDSQFDSDKDKQPAIVIQIVKEEGNLKMKQVTNGTVSDLNLEAIEIDDSKFESEARINCSNCGKVFDSEAKVLEHVCDNDLDAEEKKLFPCDLCRKWLKTLGQLLDHVKEVHTEIEVPSDYVALLFKQRHAILKIKKTALELIAMKKFKAARRMLDRSKSNLESFKMDLFGRGEVNVFRKFLESMYRDIETTLEKKILSGKMKSLKKKKKILEQVKDEKTSSAVSVDVAVKSKKKHKRNSKKLKKPKKNESDFSSEDELCLKESIIDQQEARVMEDGEIIGKLEPPDDSEICLQFYAVPVLKDGSPLSLYDFEMAHEAIKSMWSGTKVNLDSLTHVYIQRFEKEVDEILPPDTIFCGYASKSNKTIFSEVKNIADLFDENCLLNDGIRTHKTSKLKSEIDRRPSCSDESDADKQQSCNEDDINNKKSKDDIVNKKSEDEYDDGFETETAFLLSNPKDVVKKDKLKNKQNFQCDLCKKLFSVRRLLLEHVQSDHPECKERYVCKVCGITCVPRFAILKHEKQHREALEECEVCCDRFPSVEAKADHFETYHENEALLKCGVCSDEYLNYSGLQTHFKRDHLGLEDLLNVEVKIVQEVVKDKKIIKFDKNSLLAPTCEICDRKFTSIGRLQQHSSSAHKGSSRKKKK